jgi:hypothetical protein
MLLKSNEYFGGRGLHPLQPNAISPSGSVMIIYLIAICLGEGELLQF